MSKTIINSSSELMTNYVHASVVSPLKKFTALQSNNGHALLFTIGTNGAFNLLKEDSGTTAAGWSDIDLSTAQIAKDFPGKSNTVCRTFGASQSVHDGSVSLAMIVTDNDGADSLYLSLGNSNQNLAWCNAPAWVNYPYDCPDFKAPKLQVADVFFSESTGGVEYIVIDIIRDPSSTVKNIKRFYIDQTKPNEHYWQLHDISVDVEAGQYSTCMGRMQNGMIDGLYTAGKAAANGQLIFTPLQNIFGDGPANPTLLNLPNGLIADSIAASRNSDLSTDLFCTSGNGLYYFSSSTQLTSGAVGQPLFNNDLFEEVKYLFAGSTNDRVYVWGLNEANQVFYTYCPVSQITMASAWSVPLPILTKVDVISPYINAVNNGNTFFAVGDIDLVKMTQSPETTIWRQEHIHLPAPLPTSPSIKIDSYTTRIVATDEFNQPLPNHSLMISAGTRSSFYINNLYYILDTKAIPVSTDAMGSITIIESVKSLNGNKITISDSDNTPLAQIDPMAKTIDKVTQLNTSNDLKKATITYQNGSTKQLVDSGVSDDDLNAAAKSNAALKQAYDKFKAPDTAQMLRVSSNGALTISALSIGDSIVADFGDLLGYLDSGINAVVSVIEDEAGQVWHFVAKIGEKIYSSVLDAVEKVYSAFEYVFNAIKTAIKDLIDFLKFLFELADMKRTQQAVKNMTNLFLQYQIDGLKDLKTNFDGFIGGVEAKLDGWLLNKPNLDNLGSAAVNQLSNPGQHQTAPSYLLSHHLNSNINNATLTKAAAATTTADPDNVIDVLLNLINQEEQVVIDTVSKIIDLFKNINSMPIADIVKQFLDILSHTILDTAKNVLDAVFDVIFIVANKVFELLNDEFHIPVVSDILADFGISLPSLMDILTWVVAIPGTLLYKVVFNEAPFPDNAQTSKFINAKSFSEIFGQPEMVKNKMMAGALTANFAAENTATTNNNTGDAKSFKAFHVMSGIAGILNTPVSAADAVDPNPANEEGKASAFFSILSGVTWGLASFLDPQRPVQDTPYSIAAKVFLGLRIFNLVITSGKVPAISQHRKIGSIADALIGIANLVFTIEHLVELSNEPADNSRTLAILDETSFCLSYLVRWGYCAAVCVDNAYVKAGGVAAIVIGNLGYSGLQIAEAASYSQ
ncbi:hypothetical protein [Mucilaginibacter ginsenosidivorax]|uniref:Uncharacterized protein n=1 Tax=Mucilaginibacter ginsenosidivorax TaxID=862126 RepID=A0A5B8W1J4_9SPHI|nr:hypothetical protein [Mucilaginibacter ginsenosidivorax]QEC77563.1 hypothetical protein FSB76_17025 [Mucilaginibacter ginsenosidivorax]